MIKRETPACIPSRGMTRRCLITLPVLAASGAYAGAAPAIKKASKKVAGYIEKSDDSTQNCSQCHFYLNPFDCMIVEGPVSPWGYCNYYAD
ncbi:MAG TPA: hypothetical protein VH189_05790 [Rhizomicrobium sp.]|jgi:hypothetical protein|nr:hypothetical protein [Rhizomicrobium sp.]